MLEIYFGVDSEYADYVAFNRGFRFDIHVKVDGKTFELNVYTFEAISKFYKDDVKQNGFYYAEPNLVLVTDVKKETIVKTIRSYYELGFFSSIGEKSTPETEWDASYVLIEKY